MSSRIPATFAMLIAVLVLLALARPLDHDESQYVAAAVLTAHGLPYRDFAYLQAPLQPLLFAPLAWLFSGLAWPGLRIVNALLGAVAVAGVYRAARAGGAGERAAMLGAGLFACTDIFLFSVGTARNDALPVALLAMSLPLVIAAANDRGSRTTAALAGLLLAGAAAAKISYALPALAYGGFALIDRRHRPAWLAAGAAPIALLVLWTHLTSPAGFLFGVFHFPSAAPDQYYRAAGKAWKLGIGAKLIDTLKFLALGPALLGFALVQRFRWRNRSARAIDWMIVAGIIAALLPSPTWRQYLLPILPPLFLRLAIGWQAGWPGQRTRILIVVFAVAGLAPSIEALWQARGGLPMLAAARESAAIRAGLEQAKVGDGIATLSPQFLPATGRLPDPRFATGPFYFRSQGLLDDRAEAALRLVSVATIERRFAEAAPAAILVGGEGGWTSGDPRFDAGLENYAIGHGWHPVPIASQRFRLYVPR